MPPPHPRTRLRRAVTRVAVVALTVVALTLAALSSSAVSSGAAASPAARPPLGHVDVLTQSGHTLTASGWAGDPDSGTPVTIRFTVNGSLSGTALADRSRPDVGAKYPQLGSNRGFATTMPLPDGDLTVCVTADNVGGGPNVALRCASMSVGPLTKAPIGHVDRIVLANAAVQFAGWTFDPDTPRTAVRVLVSVNGRVAGNAIASASRPDVAAAYLTAGPAHGLPATIALGIGPGNYRICVGANNTGRGPAVSLGCWLLTLRPDGLPVELNRAQTAAAARALMAQAIASHAATAADFTATITDAAKIARADQLLLAQAAGRRSVPPAVAGVPAFRVATPTVLPDEQLVMGRTPSLGTYPPATSGGRTGLARASQTFANDPLPMSGAPGAGLIGAAPVLATDGVSVNPVMPPIAAGYTPLRAEVAVRAALAKLGNPYVYAAAGPGTFDCSGLTEWAWAKAGVDLYHYTGTQAVQGVRVRANQLLPGDLLLFGSDLHHVAMYLGAGYMIDAPYTGVYVRIDRVADYGDFTLAVRP